MKRKVKKFGRGGDIVTGIGAALIGKALYDKYGDKDMNKNKDASTDSPAKTQTRAPEAKAAPPFKDPDVEVTKEVPAANKDEAREAGRQRALQQSKDPRPNLVPEGLSQQDKNALYESDKALVRTDNSKAAKDAAKAAKNARSQRKAADQGNAANAANAANAPAFTGQGMAGSDTGKKEPPVLKAGESKVVGEGKLKPYPEKEAAAKKRQNFLSSKAGLSGKGIPTPGDKNKTEATSKVAKAVQGTIDNRSKSMARTPEQKMSEGAREVERRRQVEKKKKENAAYMRELERGKAMKKGGAVKKYASGGSVSSASKRADGCAIRGKTRA